ncbi:hypothetical protein SCHPADRAFT_824894, partial [Schizopora paradoxa]
MSFSSFQIQSNNEYFTPDAPASTSFARISLENTAAQPGSLAFDKKSGEFNLEWPNMKSFDAWLAEEQQYPGSSLVLGKYSDTHSHPIGNENLRYTRLSEETKESIAHLLEMHIEPSHIVSSLSFCIGDGADATKIDHLQLSRNSLVTMNDIIRVKRALDSKTIRLHRDDGVSVE